MAKQVYLSDGGELVDSDGTPVSASALSNDPPGIGTYAGLPWRYELNPGAPFANVNWGAPVVSSGLEFFNLRADSSGQQNDSITWKAQLAPGTWSLGLYHVKASTGGAYSLYLDGVDSGMTPIDGYDAGGARAFTVVTGITVADLTDEVSLVMATKNASASGHYGLLSGVVLQRTA